MRIQYFTDSASQTKKLAEVLAKEISSRPQIWGRDRRKKALTLGLEGDLGGGKTIFLKGFARGLGIKEKILSPTFVIIRKFQIPISKFKTFYHIDCYRVKRPKEILNLDFKRIISDNENIVAIEWSDRIRKILPKKILRIKFKFLNKNKRKIIFNYGK